MANKVWLYANVGPELTQYDVDVDAATLTRRDTVSLLANVQYAWPHASRQFLYVATSDSASGMGPAGTNHHVTALRIDGAPADARIVVVGVCMETDRFEPFFGIIKQLNIQFVLAYTGEEFAQSLHHIAEGKVDVTPLITGHVGLDGVKGAFAELANPEKHAKIMVQPWE